MKKSMFAFGLALSIATQAFAGPAQIDSAGNHVPALTIEIASYLVVDRDTLQAKESKLQEAFENVPGGPSNMKTELNKSYQRAYQEARDQLENIQNNPMASSSDRKKYALYKAEMEVERAKVTLQHDPRKIVIYYRPTYQLNETTTRSFLDFFGVPESEEVKTRRQQLLEQEPNRQYVLAISNAFIETMNAAPAGQVQLSAKDIVLVPSNMEANRIIIKVGTRLLNYVGQP